MTARRSGNRGWTGRPFPETVGQRPPRDERTARAIDALSSGRKKHGCDQPVAATNQVTQWLSDFGAALERGDVSAAAKMFAEECYWRDLVAFTWNIKTLEGRDAIAAMLAATLRRGAADGHWQIEGEATEADGVTEGWFTFETAVARGRGPPAPEGRASAGRC